MAALCGTAEMMKSLALGVGAAEPRCAQSSAASPLAANGLIGVSTTRGRAAGRQGRTTHSGCGVGGHHVARGRESARVVCCCFLSCPRRCSNRCAQGNSWQLQCKKKQTDFFFLKHKLVFPTETSFHHI